MECERRSLLKRLTITLLICAGVVASLLAASYATDASGFCDTCHEMQPFHEAWRLSPHAEEAECIDCHVDAGFAARLLHKPQVISEVLAHFRGDVLFPRPEAPEIPDSRCTQCHESVPERQASSGFSHAIHAEAAACSECHAQTGHAVTEEALRKADVFDADAAQQRAPSLPDDAVAAPGAGSANVEAHPQVVCSGCHDMARSGCFGCHETQLTADHPENDECLLCHPSAASWGFIHPDSADCASCHETPETEPHDIALECATCHANVESWAFEHPGSTSVCVDCHPRPEDDDHPERDDCGTCHTIAGAWEHDT